MISPISEKEVIDAGAKRRYIIRRCPHQGEKPWHREKLSFLGSVVLSRLAFAIAR